MSKGKSQIEALKQPFNAILAQYVASCSVELVETVRKKKNSDEINETEFVAVRLPLQTSEIADILDCETKHVTSVLGSASKNLTRMTKMRNRVIELAEALTDSEEELVRTHPDVRFCSIEDNKGRGPSDWVDF